MESGISGTKAQEVFKHIVLSIGLTIVSFFDIIICVSGKHCKNLQAINHDPVISSIKWTDSEAMLKSFGAEVSKRRGSRVRIALNGVKAVFHRPHLQEETDKGAVKSIRRFLKEAGIKDDDL